MYMLFKQGQILDVLRQHPELVKQYARYEENRQAASDAEVVLKDALLEVATWSGMDWKQAKKMRDKTELSLFWINAGTIRQSVKRVRTPPRFGYQIRFGPKQGWKDLDLISAHRREMRRELKRKAEPSLG